MRKACLGTNEKAWPNLRHHCCCNTNRRFLLYYIGSDKARPFRLIKKVEGDNDTVWNQFFIKREREFRAVIPHKRSSVLIDTIRVSLDAEGKTDRRCVSIQKSVPQID